MLLFSIPFIASGQDTLSLIKGRMANREEAYAKIKSSGIKNDTLQAQLKDAYECISILEVSNSSLRDSLSHFENVIMTSQLITSPDTTVFHSSFSQISIPICLEPHIALIKRISELRENIEMLEQRVDKIKETFHRANVNEIIAEEIEADIQQIYSMIEEIKKTDLSTLSIEQKEYFTPGLTERYNKFSIYFE